MFNFIYRSRFGICLFATGIFLLVSAHASLGQNGWTKKKGEMYSKLYVINGESDNYFNLEGVKTTTQEFTQVIGGLYLEYGISERLTLITNWPFIKHQYFNNTEKITGIGDLPLGIKYGLIKGTFPVSLGVTAEIPIAKSDNFARNLEQTNFIDQINLPTGDGEWNFRLTAAGSHSFNNAPFPVFISLFSTLNYRTEYAGINFSHQLNSGMGLGANIFNKKIWLELGISAQQSLGESEQVDFVRGEGTEFTSYSISSSYVINSN
ncbi:MAG: hypothetical protein RLO12_18780, partial [Fulvivirga sp.]